MIPFSKTLKSKFRAQPTEKITMLRDNFEQEPQHTNTSQTHSSNPSFLLHYSPPHHQPTALNLSQINQDNIQFMSQIPLILDVDPGHDDFFLILFALFSQRANVLGISTVGGNQSLEKVTINTLNALNIFTNKNVIDPSDTKGLRDVDFGAIPVVAGAEHSLIGTNTPCPEIHGETGLETTDKSFLWPELKNKAITGIHSVQYFAKVIEDYAAQNDEKVHIIATGRLTNIALLLTMYPHITKSIAQITVMGGSYRQGGNMHPTAEFNIQIDPEAAQVVFQNGCSPTQMTLLQTTQTKPSTTTLLTVPIVLVPLDVTHTVLVTQDIINRIGAVCQIPVVKNNDSAEETSDASVIETITSPFGRLLTDLLTFFANTYRDLFLFKNGPPLHDPVTFFYLLAVQHNKSNETMIAADPNSELTTTPLPPLFKSVHTRVDVDTSHGICRGTTAVDMFGMLPHKPEPNVILTLEVNVEAFWDHLLKAMEQANKQCILNSPGA